MQRLGREFPEEEAVIPGEATEVPNTELSGNLGDGCLRRVGGFERCPNLVKCSPIEILHRRYTEILLKRIAQGSLGNPSRCGELFHWEVLAIMLVDEIHRHANDLASRNRVPADWVFDFRRRREHVADLPSQLLLRCFL